MVIGYIRCSSPRSKGLWQESSIGPCDRLYREQCSGHTKSKRILTSIIYDLRPGDLIVVASVERLARSTSLLKSTLKEIWSRGADVRINWFDRKPLYLRHYMSDKTKEHHLRRAIAASDMYFVDDQDILGGKALANLFKYIKGQ